jgi:streptogramin lyase
MLFRPGWRNALAAILAMATALLLALPAFASADPLGSVTVFKGLRAKASIFTMAPGPDGNAWFIDINFAGSPAIGKLAVPGGSVTEYIPEDETHPLTGLNEESRPISITAAPKGEKYLWFTDHSEATPAIGVIDSASPGTVIKECSIAANGGNAESAPEGIVAGSDGNLWFTDISEAKPAIGMINPSTCEVKEFSTGLQTFSRPMGIVAGSDGRLWFTDQAEEPSEPSIGAIDPVTHEIKEFGTGEESVPGGTGGNIGSPNGIAPGPDGNIWFSEGKTGATAICRIEVSGPNEIKCYKAGLAVTSRPRGITAAKGKLWFADNSGVNEKQTLKFTGTWAAENEFELCNEAKSKCAKAKYSLTGSTLASRVKTALETVYGSGNVAAPFCSGTPATCSFSFAGELSGTDVGQTGCKSLIEAGACTAETNTKGVANAIGRITTSGEITRYPTEGLAAPDGITYASNDPGDVWAIAGQKTDSEFIKFGIEEGPTNLRTLTLTKSAGGSGGIGSVTSKPKGINCGSACNKAEASMYEETPVVLKEKPSAGSTFVEWTGACSGSAETCTVPMSEDESVGAVFGGTSKAIVEPKALTLSKGESSGKGTVKASGLYCEAACTSTTVLYQGPVTLPKPKPGKTVELSATAAYGSEFSGWSGSGCSGKGSCVVTMEEAKSVTAEFAAKPTTTLTLKKNSYITGTGTVTSKPKAINCATTCTTQTASLPQGEAIVLKEKPATGMTFTGWSGGGCSGTAETCTVTPSGATEVTATFSGSPKAIAEAKKLTLTKAGSGFGTVKATGLTCEAACTSATSLYAGPVTLPKPKPGKVVILKATSAAGSKTVVWSGCKAEPEGNCEVEMSEDKNVTATFDELE